jgi:histone-lysine N-methyltransferase SETMAR
MAKINQLKYDWLPYSPYSPDLAPFDFQLFPKLKMFLGGPRFSSNEEVTSVVDDYFAYLKETTFRGDESLRTSLNKVH